MSIQKLAQFPKSTLRVRLPQAVLLEVELHSLLFCLHVALICFADEFTSGLILTSALIVGRVFNECHG